MLIIILWVLKKVLLIILWLSVVLHMDLFLGTYFKIYERNLYTDKVLEGEFPIYRGFKLNEEDLLRRDIIKTIRTYLKSSLLIMKIELTIF